MRAHRWLVPALVLAISTPAMAQKEVPAALRNLKPYQIVEAVIAERQALGFTEIQVARLESLHQAIRTEPHRYQRAPSLKAHRNVRMEPMISKKRAYADALAIMTPDQRTGAAARFGDPSYQLPEELQPSRPVAQGQAEEPLQHHAVGATPAEQVTDSAEPEDPLQHRGGEFPPAAEDQGAKPTNPVTHQE
jgi:hypothetical protein